MRQLCTLHDKINEITVDDMNYGNQYVHEKFQGRRKWNSCVPIKTDTFEGINA